MHDPLDSEPRMEPVESQRIKKAADRPLKEKAFRLAVARLYYHDGKDTAQVAGELGVEECQVWNVLRGIQKRVDA